MARRVNGAAVTIGMFDEPKTLADCKRVAEKILFNAHALATAAEELASVVAALEASCDAKPFPDEPKPKPHPIKACLTYFDNKHRQRLDGAPAKIDGAKDATIIKRLIDTYGEDRVCTLIEQFFETDDEFTTQKTGFTVGAFSSRVPGLISSTAIARRTMGVTRNTEGNARSAVEAASMIRNSYGNGNGAHR
jgi:hypothetical protein